MKKLTNKTILSQCLLATLLNSTVAVADVVSYEYIYHAWVHNNDIYVRRSDYTEKTLTVSDKTYKVYSVPIGYVTVGGFWGSPTNRKNYVKHFQYGFTIDLFNGQTGQSFDSTEVRAVEIILYNKAGFTLKDTAVWANIDGVETRILTRGKDITGAASMAVMAILPRSATQIRIGYKAKAESNPNWKKCSWVTLEEITAALFNAKGTLYNKKCDIEYSGTRSDTAYVTTALDAGKQLQPGDLITSANGDYRLVYQQDGNLVVYDISETPVSAVWSSGTAGTSPGRVSMQANGNLVIYDGSSNSAIWSSGTHNNPGALLQIGSDGSLRIVDVDGDSVNTVFWNSQHTVVQPPHQMSPGDSVHSPNGQYRLTNQNDGNVVLYDLTGPTVLWSTKTSHKYSPGNLNMQADGNLVLYYANGVLVWTSDTMEYPVAYLGIGNDGSLILYSKAGWEIEVLSDPVGDL